ncbi:MAG: helix-turn-helix domain-containing protein [Flavobacteriaceae bacterium]|nr:MAG: helix-turn-helix domain-containing protein [Flavobacteriaceae bacterium]
MNIEEQSERTEFVFIKRQDLKEELRLLMTETISEYKQEKIWITAKEAMALLAIKSATTLQMLRNTGKIEFSQPMKKLILYKKSSVLEYLEKHSRKTW